jgi:hypothetical protein
LAKNQDPSVLNNNPNLTGILMKIDVASAVGSKRLTINETSWWLSKLGVQLNSQKSEITTTKYSEFLNTLNLSLS